MAPGWWPLKKQKKSPLPQITLSPPAPREIPRSPAPVDLHTPLTAKAPLNRSSSLQARVPSTLAPRNPRTANRISIPVRKRTRLVIGIDYGTSHSGVAWALFDPEAGIDPRKVDIRTVRDWPGNRTGEYTASKVSSEISYNHTKLHWGFDIPDDGPGSKKLKWVKLLLEPEPNLKDKSTINEAQEQLKAGGQTEVDAASDYLTCLWEHSKARIIKAITQAVFDFADKIIVLTIPAVWSPKAKHNSYLVAVKAGLSDVGYSLKIVTEPEAAAISVLKDKANTFKMGDCFVVCDAGGGTVDVTSYQIENTEPLCLRERVIGDGGLCGSVFIDIAFKRYLRTLITEEVFDKIAPRHMAKMMHEFESCIKRQFSCQEEKSYIFDLIGVPHSSGDVSIRLTQDLLTPLFDTVCSDIETLIDKQIRALKKKDITPKALMLVGGLGGNKYLLERLHEMYPEDEVEIMQPENSLEAVSTGAVLCELLGIGNVVDVHLSRINIGIKCNELFREGHHLPEDKFFCTYVEKHKAKNQVVWFVLKGDKIRTGGKSIFPFTWINGVKASDPDTKVTVKAHLVRSTEDKAPTRRTSAVHNFVTIKFNVDRSIFENAPQRLNSDGKLFWYIDYEVEMTMGPAMLQFSCIINGVVRDSTSVVYHAAVND